MRALLSPLGAAAQKETTLATYVLVHGGAHGGRCDGRVAPALRAAGHDVHAPTLTGLGDRSHRLRPDIDLDFHIPSKCFTQPLRLSNETARWEIPKRAIGCTSNPAFRDPGRPAPARAAGRLWDVDTGRDLMISEPEAVAELLARVAAAPDGARYRPRDEGARDERA